MTSSLSYSLPHFEGPLDLLLYLIQKQEVDLWEISTAELADQFSDYLKQKNIPLETSAEFLHVFSSLMLIKTQRLLPKELASEQEEDLDLNFEIIHKLLEYSKFKHLAKSLTAKEADLTNHFSRGNRSEPPKRELPPGVDHLSLAEIASHFQEALKKVKTPPLIQEEEWRTNDLMQQIRQDLQIHKKLPLCALFAPTKGKLQLIVTFLALLELMKLHDVAVILDPHTEHPWVIAPSHYNKATA